MTLRGMHSTYVRRIRAAAPDLSQAEAAAAARTYARLRGMRGAAARAEKAAKVQGIRASVDELDRQFPHLRGAERT